MCRSHGSAHLSWPGPLRGQWTGYVCVTVRIVRAIQPDWELRESIHVSRTSNLSVTRDRLLWTSSVSSPCPASSTTCAGQVDAVRMPADGSLIPSGVQVWGSAEPRCGPEPVAV